MPIARTIKLVIVGDSGVGKTSLRSQYLYGRFSTGYRATIGTDFITKTLPHHSNPNESVTLQIWDTAGQERFSSLSTAFFRGADAVLCVFDVNKPETLEGVKRWWIQFSERAPVREGEEAEYCCVVVGNKTDLSPSGPDGSRKSAVSEADARHFLHDLIPSDNDPLESLTPPGQTPATSRRNSTATDNHSDGASTARPATPQLSDDGVEFPQRPRSSSINIAPSSHRPSTITPSPQTSRSRLVGTMTTINTSISVYHTPSSSLFDEPESPPPSPSPPGPLPQSNGLTPTHNTIPHPALSSTPTSSTLTLTRPKPDDESTELPPPSPPLTTSPPPEVGPKLLFCSARTGESVPTVFEYIARRVVTRWEWEEQMEERISAMNIEREAEETIRLSDKSKWRKACCT